MIPISSAISNYRNTTEVGKEDTIDFIRIICYCLYNMSDTFERQTTMDPTGKGVLSEDYDKASEKSGWDSPERAQKLVDGYITDGSTVLDVGVGTGKAVKGYAEKGATIIGLDYDSEMLAKAQEVTGESGLMVEADINGQWPIGKQKSMSYR